MSFGDSSNGDESAVDKACVTEDDSVVIGADTVGFSSTVGCRNDNIGLKVRPRCFKIWHDILMSDVAPLLHAVWMG